MACSPRIGTTISRRSIACENVEIGVELAAEFGPRSDLGHHHDGGRVAGNGRPPGGIGKPVLRIVMVTTQAAGFGQSSEYPEYLEYFFGHSQPDADGNGMAQKEFEEFKVFGLFGFFGWPVAAGALLRRDRHRIPPYTLVYHISLLTAAALVCLNPDQIQISISG